MKKITTLFKKDPNDLSRVINEINPGNEWVGTEDSIATRKFDGTSCAIINGKFYKRYDVKKGRNVPDGAIPCQDPDEITGHWPHWVEVDESKPENKWFIDGYKTSVLMNYDTPLSDGTYELCGPEFNGNKEGFGSNHLVPHGKEILDINSVISYFFGDNLFYFLRGYLTGKNIEGIVFHNIKDGRMCKIRKTDFGIKR